MLAVSRIAGIFGFAPIFSSKSIPIPLKSMLSFLIAYISLSYIDSSTVPQNQHIFLDAFLLLKEFFIGASLGFIGTIIFVSVQFAGRFMDMRMGLHMASMMDPMTREQQSMSGQLFFTISMMLLLVSNGHLIIIKAVVRSFEKVPIGWFDININVFQFFFDLFVNIFVLSIQLAAPLAAMAFMVDVAFGLAAKAVPQMNVFMIAMPFKNGLGLLVVTYLIYYMYPQIENIFKLYEASMSQFIYLLNG
jgi:flagellar biosynthesis protein FliR